MNKFRKVRSKVPPPQQAEEIASKCVTDDMITAVKADKGYVYFWVNRAVTVKTVLKKICQEKEKFGSSNEGEGKTIVAEFSSPNIAKPFHAGHLRSTIIGNFIKQVHLHLGYKVSKGTKRWKKKKKKGKIDR